MTKAEAYIKSFLSERNPETRYASFDYCYGYFRPFRDKTKEKQSEIDEQTACMQLMCYLASWGMFRGSSALLREKNMRHFLPFVKKVASGGFDELWDIDCDDYSSQKIQKLIDAYNEVKELVVVEKQQPMILTTKVMLGVFGCCPAFDTRVTTSLRRRYPKKSGGSGFRTFNAKALELVAECYTENHTVIDSYAESTQVYDFSSNESPKHHYTKSKVLDMLLFSENDSSFNK